MSVPDRKNWLQKMLSDFEERATYWLNEMHFYEPNLIFDEEFERMFLNFSNERLASTYSMVKKQLGWKHNTAECNQEMFVSNTAGPNDEQRPIESPATNDCEIIPNHGKR